MEKKQSLKRLAIPVLVFILGFGLMAGCNDKKSNEDEGNNNEDMEMSQNNGMSSQDQMNNDNMRNGGQEMTADLSGENEVPANDSNAEGSVTVTVKGDSIHVEGDFSGLSSNYTASHIHKGAKGTNGDVLQPLDPKVNSDKTSGSFDSWYKMDQSQMSALKGGNLYVNVHSQNHKNGEIRGQLTSSDMGMDDSMNDDDSMDN